MSDGKPSKTLLSKIIETIIFCLLGLVVAFAFNFFKTNLGMPKDFKEAKKFLKNEGFSTVKYSDDEDKIDDVFDGLDDLYDGIDLDIVGVEKALFAHEEDSGDLFWILYCDDVLSAKKNSDELTYLLYVDEYLCYNEYTVFINYRTVYFGNEDLIFELLD